MICALTPGDWAFSKHDDDGFGTDPGRDRRDFADHMAENQRDLCRCGAIRDDRGFHRLACLADTVRDCAFAAGLLNKGGMDVPVLPGTNAHRGDLSIEVQVPAAHGGSPTRGFVCDVSLATVHKGASAISAEWGTPKPKALEDVENTKVSHYAGYASSLHTPWTFVPLVCSTLGHLQPRFIRLINFLAEHQAARALESDMLGEEPDRVRKLVRLRMQGRVACAVAVATAMRLGGHWADIHHPVKIPPRFTQVLPHLAETDLPLFPRGSEGAPVASHFPLPRGGPADDLFADAAGV